MDNNTLPFIEIHRHHSDIPLGGRMINHLFVLHNDIVYNVTYACERDDVVFECVAVSHVFSREEYDLFHVDRFANCVVVRVKSINSTSHILKKHRFVASACNREDLDELFALETALFDRAKEGKVSSAELRTFRGKWGILRMAQFPSDGCDRPDTILDLLSHFICPGAWLYNGTCCPSNPRVFLNLRSYNTIMMATSFTRAITQFATLRVFARTPPRKHECVQLMRDLFPNARVEPHVKQSSSTLFEIAWSFLSHPTITTEYKIWMVDDMIHRAGDLPAFIGRILLHWYAWDAPHRATLDPKTGHTLPAYVNNYVIIWEHHGREHRTDCDVRTGLMLPAYIGIDEFKWMRDGLPYRDEMNLASGLLLPTHISFDMMTRNDWTRWKRLKELCR